MNEWQFGLVIMAVVTMGVFTTGPLVPCPPLLGSKIFFEIQYQQNRHQERLYKPIKRYK